MNANFCRCGNLTESVCPRCGTPICDRCAERHRTEHLHADREAPQPAA